MLLCWRGGGAVLAFLLLVHGLLVDGQDTSTDRLILHQQIVVLLKSLLCIPLE